MNRSEYNNSFDDGEDMLASVPLWLITLIILAAIPIAAAGGLKRLVTGKRK